MRQSLPLDLRDRCEFLEEHNRQLQKLIDDLADGRTMTTSFRLSRPQAVVYNALKRYGTVSTETMCELVQTQTEGYSLPSNIRFLVRKIREKLPENERIETLRGLGWVLHVGSMAQSGHTLCSSIAA